MHDDGLEFIEPARIHVIGDSVARDVMFVIRRLGAITLCYDLLGDCTGERVWSPI
jgi:hypothetical protein